MAADGAPRRNSLCNNHHSLMDVLSGGATKIFQACFDDHRALLREVELSCAELLARLAALSANALRNGGKLLFFGNGGSAADAQHLAAELTIRFIASRRPLAA